MSIATNKLMPLRTFYHHIVSNAREVEEQDEEANPFRRDRVLRIYETQSRDVDHVYTWINNSNVDSSSIMEVCSTTEGRNVTSDISRFEYMLSVSDI